ncbi:hypothetical protein PIB30_046558 [Stylosanthes scabra]|uniref:Uncharacterized protein n=1 Tax=Stylosanthes scabra TaxID=79078 RepID=A0ABU6VFA4_9FABA|nr:hypothetical protein [Stylosanthes scabra]
MVRPRHVHRALDVNFVIKKRVGARPSGAVDSVKNWGVTTFKIGCYHFDGESFVHPLHSVRFYPDHSYEIPIEALMADQPLSSSRNGMSSTRGSYPSRCSSPTPHYSTRGLSSS